MYENLIPALTTATRIACLQLTDRHITVIGDGIEQATRSPGTSDWESGAAAHATIFTLLAEAVEGPDVVRVLMVGERIVRELAFAAGPAANGLITTFNQRLLAYLRAKDADAAEHEVERQLNSLHFMWRLARSSGHPVLSCRLNGR